MLKEETAAGGLVTTSLHPGHIVGPGWHPIGPVGNLDPSVWRTLSAGQPLRVPGIGAELHAPRARRRRRPGVRARRRRSGTRAAGEDFNVVSPTALTVRGYARRLPAGSGMRPRSSRSPGSGSTDTSGEYADSSWEHLVRSQCFSIEKAHDVLGYTPQHSSLDTVRESVRWLIDHDQLTVARSLTI